ncbi:MFS transporter [Bacilliculturomica massiliensis]|uniref:MFS transporter n=1 Tax=Bacilliculturomica massiliensis TaxID=1917867 RepID=UPI00102F66C4|nr:MFS transporter [Bacilliculturomica massiliensis]
MLEKPPFRLTPKVVLAVISIGLINSIVFTIPYIKYTFYFGMIELTGCTNEQLGLLLTIYGLGEVFSLPIGGLLVEKYDVKKVLLFSTIGTGLLCFLIVLFPSYATTALVWFGLIFTSLFMFWGAIFKGLRILAPTEYQGRMNGFYSGASGLGYFIIGLTMVPIYDYFASISDGQGMRAVFVFLGIFCFVIAVFCYFAVKAALDEQKANGWNFVDEEQEQIGGIKGLLEGFKAVAKYKAVWVFGICLFCVYGIEICISYTTSYFTDVLGITVTFGAVLSIFRSYGMKIVGAPLGGMISDKIGSPAKVVIVGNLVAAVCLVAIVILPTEALTLPVLMAIILITAWFNSMCYGVQFAIPAEAKLPANLAASAIGLGSAIGYIPDVYQHAMIGSWLDKWGVAAYPLTFCFGIALSVVATVVLFIFLRDKKRGTLVFGAK